VKLVLPFFGFFKGLKVHVRSWRELWGQKDGQRMNHNPCGILGAEIHLFRWIEWRMRLKFFFLFFIVNLGRPSFLESHGILYIGSFVMKF